MNELFETLATAAWEPRGTARVLRAACRHPAVEVALREHAAALDDLFDAVQAVAAKEVVCKPLAELPTHATADRVHADELESGGRAYRSAGVRFRLAEDRVQELLMGEQLYGDPGLAVRELYQNALDACRYRRAREDYLAGRASESGKPIEPWAGGSIEFTQGVDGNGAYIECRDNGIGMGLRELTEVFSQAGTRYADLPEFLEEQTEWARYGVRLFPNSRFGIGVLSYFMLADEITVDTCRLDRQGRPGTTLRVTIAGPGNLFRIRELGPGSDAGTTVRLHLNQMKDQPASALAVLRAVLWVSEFDTTAIQDGEPIVWRRGELSELAPIGSYDPLQSYATRSTTQVVAASVPNVWWCSAQGAVLADGLWAGTKRFGVIVSLSGELAPRLSVDRKQILAHDDREVSRLMARAAPDLCSPKPPEFVSLEWLESLAEDDPGAADAVWSAIEAAGQRIPAADDVEVDSVTVGCFPGDIGWIRHLNRRASRETFRPAQIGPGSPNLTSEVFAWRLEAWRSAGITVGDLLPEEDSAEPVIPARPADAVLLSSSISPSILQPDNLTAAASRLDWTPEEVLARLAKLGIRGTPDSRLQDMPLGEQIASGRRDAIASGMEAFAQRGAAAMPAASGITRDDLVIVSRDLDGIYPWLDHDGMTHWHILRAAARTGRTIDSIRERLQALGFLLPPASADGSARLEKHDAELIEGIGPWAWESGSLPLPDLLRASAVVPGATVKEVSDRLKLLGIESDPGNFGNLIVGQDDAALVHAVGGRGLPIPVVALHQVGKGLKLSSHEVAARLESLGFAVSHRAMEWREIDDNTDLRLLTRDLDALDPWLTADEVPVSHVLRAAYHLGLAVADVCTRFASLGLLVPAAHRIQRQTASDDDRRVLRTVEANANPYTSRDVISPVTVMQLVNENSPDAVAVTTLETLGFTVPSLETLTEIDRSLLQQVQGQWADRTEIYMLSRDLRLPPREIAERLVRLGFATSVRMESLAAALEGEDEILLSRSLSGDVRQLAGDHVPLSRVLLAADATERTCGHVIERLGQLGYATDACSVEGHRRLTEDDRNVLTEFCDVGAGAPVNTRRLLLASLGCGVAPGHVARTLNALGYTTVDAAKALRNTPFPVDGSQFLERVLSRFEVDVYTLREVLRLADECGMAPLELGDRLSSFGLHVEGRHLLPAAKLTADHVQLLEMRPRDCAQWLREPLATLTLRFASRVELIDTRMISALDMVAVAERLARPGADVMRQLTGLGMKVPRLELVAEFPLRLAASESLMQALSERSSGRYGYARPAEWIGSEVGLGVPDEPARLSALEVLELAGRLDLEPLTLARHLRARGQIYDPPERVIGRRTERRPGGSSVGAAETA